MHPWKFATPWFGSEHCSLRCCRYNTLNVQAGTQLCDGAFQREVATGKLSSASLDDYSCIALAGVATEYLRFGRAEGGNNDVAQLDAMLKGLQVREYLFVCATVFKHIGLLRADQRESMRLFIVEYKK